MDKTVSKWLVLVTVMVGTLLGMLDRMVVNLGIPHIIDDFGITVTAAGWIATVYILANAIFVPVWGKLGDTIGRKRVYLAGFAIFIVGSVLAGLSWNLSSLLVFRVIQAIASSADYPTAMGILAVTFTDPKQRAQVLGLWSASFAVGIILGPLIGGPLIDLFGWRSVFLVNLPVGIIGILMAIAFVPESVSPRSTARFDWWGSVVLGVALATMVLVLDRGLDWGWFSANALMCYAISILAFLYFYDIERKHKEPIINLAFFKIGAFVNTLINNFIVFMAMMGSVFLIPIFTQTFLGLNATQSGYIFLPMAFGLMLAAPIGGMLTGSVQPRWIMFVSTIGAALGIFLFSYLDPRSTTLSVMIPMAIMAIFLGSGMAQRTSIIASVVPDAEVGVASGVLTLVRNIAGAFGIAIFGTILSNTVNSNVLSIASHSTINSADPSVIAQGVGLIELKAQVAAYADVFLIASIVVAIGAFLALTIRVRTIKAGAVVHAEG